MSDGIEAPPRFSVVTPVHNPPVPVLEAMLASVRGQTFPDWEHCLVDDASTSAEVQAVLQAAEDPRVRVERRATNGGIAAASNQALAMARGEFVALLDHDDELHPEALGSVDQAIGANVDVDYVYTDEDRIDEAGRHATPFFKPDWSPERFRCQMYTGHLSVLRRHAVAAVGGFDPDLEGSQDWDLVLRVTEHGGAVAHVPRVLYHWRMLASSTAGSNAQEAKPWAFAAGTRALQAHCDRTGFEATVIADQEIGGVHHLVPALRARPLVSAVIPTAGTRREVRGRETTLVTHCVRSLVEMSSYDPLEIVCVVDTSTPPDVIDELRDIGGEQLVVVPYDKPFNYSEKINLGALASRGEHLLLLNDDMEVITSDFVERLVMYSQVPGIGAVGAKLLYGDGRVQHAGVVFRGRSPGHVYRGFTGDHLGYWANARVPANYSAVTGACLMTRREVFDEVGGLSELLPLNFNDLDYCLKLRFKGYRVVLDPDSRLFHYELSSRIPGVEGWERDLVARRWSSAIEPDPYYHPAFVAGSVNFVPPVCLADGTLI